MDDEIQRIKGILRKVRQTHTEPEYDVALSYASEDRAYVEQVAEVLKQHGIRVFYDRDEEQVVDGWGKNLYEHLNQVYRKLARYTIMFISAHYATKVWTTVERRSAQARAFKENYEYILPARFDDTELPGLLETAYVSLKNLLPTQVAEMIRKKVESRRI